MEYLYDKLSKDYKYLEDIMGAFYVGKLKYEGVLPALDGLRNKLLDTQKNCRSNARLYDRVGQTLKYLEDIMGALYEGKLNTEEVVPALGELAVNILEAQKYFANGNEFLISKIDNKESALAKALESTKGNVR